MTPPPPLPPLYPPTHAPKGHTHTDSLLPNFDRFLLFRSCCAVVAPIAAVVAVAAVANFVAVAAVSPVANFVAIFDVAVVFVVAAGAIVAAVAAVAGGAVVVAVVAVAAKTNKTANAATNAAACDAHSNGKEYFQDAAGQVGPCRQTSACGAGFEEIVPPTSSSDRQCQACPSGTFAGVDDVLCSPISSCDAGQEVAVVASPSRDRTVTIPSPTPRRCAPFSLSHPSAIPTPLSFPPPP